MRKSLLLMVLIICVSVFSCGKANPVPSTSFSFQADINPTYSALNSPGGYAYVNGYGVAGLLLYHSLTRGIVAYDRCSTYQAEKKCAVTVDDTGLQAVDPCSGSKFSLEDGTPVKAPATQALRSYQVLTTAFTIQVYN
jgi:nitrite reductase/ring-hydroxylating ferredoxin subunit